MNRLSYILLLLLLPLAASAQDCAVSVADISAQETGVQYVSYPQKTYFVGCGSADVLDTYLSPFSYTGTGAYLAREVQYDHTLHNLSVSGCLTENPFGNVHEYVADIRYGVAHQFTVLNCNGLYVKAGPMASVLFGGILNGRNGNNPTQIKASLTADFSARIGYALRIGRMTLPIQYTIGVPCVGVAFSPDFGQSYYELTLGMFDHNIKFSNFVDAPSMCHRLTVGLPIRKHILKVGYMGRVDQSRYNSLRYHYYTHSLILGFEL